MFRASRRAIFAARLATARRRVLPDFFIIGAQKAGTSSLYRYLERHPCILPAFTKEVQYFQNLANFVKGERWYRAHFPTRGAMHRTALQQDHPCITGEATPLMYHPHAPERVAGLLPGAKLIVLLRNPVERAFSHYHHQHRRGREPLSFSDAIDAEPERLEGEVERLKQDDRYVARNFVAYSYLYRGIYADQLLMWEAFYPRDRFLVLDSDELFTDPGGAYRRVLEFLDLPPFEIPGFSRHNVGRYKSKIDEATRARLVSYFRPHNDRLWEHLGVDFGWDS